MIQNVSTERSLNSGPFGCCGRPHREDSLDLALFEAAFCFTCHEVRMQGTAVPPTLATQFFDPGARPARTLLSLFRKEAP
ncbi:hypothetical protein ABZY05_39390 [Streptomyces canus]|uniref:hypothetical protein n=1 Tax=Streptomyces canus TaxID=58343 RepID=UPI0033A96E70